MTQLEVINLQYLSNIHELPEDFVKRDSLMDLIITKLKQHDLVLIDGESGFGKTTLLTDLVKHNPYSAISHFINHNYHYTYSFECILESLYRQIYFYCNNEILDTHENINLSLLNAIQGRLFRKIRENRKKGIQLFFVIDGLEWLSKTQLEPLIPIFDNLPWKEAKFIFTGANDKISILHNNKTLNTFSIPIGKFGIAETKEYFKNFETDESNILEIHKLGSVGLPSRLKEIKLLCENSGGIKNFLDDENITERTNFLEKLWSEVENSDKVLIDTLSLTVFNDIEFEISTLSEIVKVTTDNLRFKLSNLTFIDLTENKVRYKIETIRKFAKSKLKYKEDEINAMLIDYYEVNPEEEDSRFNLPNLYKKAKKWERLTKFFTIDTFIHLLDKYQTMGNLNIQFTEGFYASKQLNSKFNEARLRFALHKSSVKDLEKHELWGNEIEARMNLGEYDQALKLANSVLLKEDRLKLLAILAKQRKIKDCNEDTDLSDQIKNLYEQIDFSRIREKGFEIAAILIYTNTNLAIELVEKVTDNSANGNSLDEALAYLMLYVNEVNKKSKSPIADVETINTKIKNNDLKNITQAFGFMSNKFNANEIISHVNSLTKFSQKIFLLKNWIKGNKENQEIAKVIEYTLEEIVKSSDNNVPSATTLSEIAIPLPLINNTTIVEKLITLFDTHKNIIDRPTKDYVKLQLKIAEALINIDYSKATDRIFDVYLLIDELSDLSIKTDCLCLLWLFLSKNDKENIIERSLSSTDTIESQSKKNIELLLKDTAFHFKIVEFIISTIITESPVFVFETIEKLNTEERRDAAFYKAIESYIHKKNVSDIDFDVINKFQHEIKNILPKELITLELIKKYHSTNENIKPFIEKLVPYIIKIKKISNIEHKCYAITHLISILNLEKESYKIHITDLSCELYKSWCQIDILWDKINTGFLIACYLSDFSKDEAIIYLNQSTELKQKEAFSSDATAKTYIKSIKLSIKAFCGLILFEDNLLKPLELLDHEISVLQSNGEKLKLWSEIHLRLLIHKKKDISEMVYKRFIYPLLNEWESNIVDSYRVDTIVSIIPSIYKHNIGIFNDYFEKFDNNNKDSSINRICNFILTKLLSDDPCSEKQKIDKLEYSDINDISDLILKATNDFLIYNLIGKTVKAIKDNKASLTTEQKNHLKQKLKNIINTQFPVNTGIKHEGYKILAESEVLSLEIYDEKEWNHLISRANAIPNISDKAIILVQLAEVITIKSSNKKKVALMENAYNFIKMIPSIYDKTNRYDGTWEILYEIDQNQFKKHIKLAYQDILSCKDGEITAIKNLVDVAQQHDSQLAQEFITMLDKDPARQKLKNPLLKRVENKEKVDKACKQIELTIKLGDDQFREAYNNILTDFNDGRKVSKDISDTFQILDKASELSLDDAFDSYAYFIQNACKKYESNKKDKDNLNSIFYATIENTRLIGILSSDSINKMKNLYNINKESHVNPVISSGEKEKAIQYLKKWFSENVEKNLIIIDPYFTEDELNLIQLIQEVSPQCSVKVLTSKKSKNNNYIDSETGKSNNKDIYIKKWQSISSDKPLNLTVKIVWDKDTLECPFHDRWYVNEDCKSKKGLAVGTSFNGLGNRDSQINELDSDGYSNVNGLINKYLYREEAKVENFNLKYERFDLED